MFLLGLFFVIGFIAIYKLFRRLLPLKSIAGQVVLITGGGSGLGRYMVINCLEAGATVISVDIRKELLGTLEKELKEMNLPGKLFTYVCDISSRNAVYQLGSQVEREVGPVDILINNAGIIIGKPLLHQKVVEIQRTMDVNCISNFWTIKAFVPGMVNRQRGHVVTISSTAGMIGAPLMSDYCTSKFATVGLTESLRAELNKMGAGNVKTSLVCLGFMNTGMFEGFQQTSWTKILVPHLDPSQTAAEIIRCVRLNDLLIILPSSFYAFLFVRAILPTSWSDKMGIFSGLLNVMDKFKGRGTEWAMKKIN